jgi:hypothetical protein
MVISGAAVAFSILTVVFRPAKVLMVPLWEKPEGHNNKTRHARLANDLADSILADPVLADRVKG